MFDWIAKLAELRANNTPHILVTITHVAGSAPRELGTRMIVKSDGSFFGTIGGGKLEQQILLESVNALATQKSHRFTKKITLCEQSDQCCGGTVEALLEVFNFRAKLYIFGSGHVGIAVARTLSDTPIEPVIIDSRKDWLDKNASDIKTLCGDSIAIAQVTDFNPKDYAVVMTHSHELDLELLKILATKKLDYLGLIGSRGKWSRFKYKLESFGIAPEQIENIECPIGIDLGGGKSPKEIAISLAAGLLKLYYQNS